MKIDPRFFFNRSVKAEKTATTAQPEKRDKLLSSEYNATRGFLVLSTEDKNACDSKKTYYINKDGSGRTVSVWGSEDYPSNTFSDILSSARKLSEKNETVRFSFSEIEGLINDAEERIKNYSLEKVR